MEKCEFCDKYFDRERGAHMEAGLTSIYYYDDCKFADLQIKILEEIRELKKLIFQEEKK